MYFHVVGIDYKNTPIALRERGAFSRSKIVGLKQLFSAMNILEFVVVSTCNRSEIYFMTKEASYEAVLNYYMSLLGVREHDYFYAYSEENAMEHLLRVTCGLESLVIGEDQILGQVKDALSLAMEHQFSGKILNKLFRESITFAKKTKTVHRISENQTSVGSISIKFVEERLGSYKGKRVLIVGSGETGELVMKYLVNQGLESLSIINRTKCHAHRIIKNFEEVQVLDYDERYKYLQEYDAIFSATASPHMIFTKSEVEKHLIHDVVFMDLAVPRDIDSAINELKKASVYTVDDLRSISNENIAFRTSLLEDIESEIKEKVKTLTVWIKNSQLDVTIAQLKKMQEAHVKEAIESIEKKVTLDDASRVHMDVVIKAMVKKLFKHPVDALKALEEDDDIEMYQDVLTDLFKLEKVR